MLLKLLWGLGHSLLISKIRTNNSPKIMELEFHVVIKQKSDKKKNLIKDQLQTFETETDTENFCDNN